MRLPLTDGLAFVIVMAAPLEVAQATRRLARAQARFLLLVFALLSSPSKHHQQKSRLAFFGQLRSRGTGQHYLTWISNI
jgi:hypothetical protein